MNGLEWDWQVFLLVALIAVGGVGWLLVTAVSLWRTGEYSRRNRILSEYATFLDSVIGSDRRYPIWIWRDGQVQIPSSLMGLLGLEFPPRTVAELENPAIGFTHAVVEEIHNLVKERATPRSPIVLDPGIGHNSYILTIQQLMVHEERWPSAVVWIEHAPEIPSWMEGAGIHGIEERLSEYRSALNSVPFPIWVRDKDMTIRGVNYAYLRAVEVESEKHVIDQQIELFTPAPLKSAHKAVSTNALAQEQLHGVVSGARRAFSVVHVPFNQRQLLGAATDITGQEETLAELERVLEAQSETLNRLQTPVTIFSASKSLQFFNEAFVRFSGLSAERLNLDVTHAELLDLLREKRRVPEQVDFPKWKREILERYNRIFESEEEYWHLPDGSTHRVMMQPHPFGGLQVMLEDVTESLALEQSYNTLMAVQQETLDNMKEAVAVFGQDGRMQLSNPAFVRLWNIPETIQESPQHLEDLAPLFRANLSVADSAADIATYLPVWIQDRTARNGTLNHKDGNVSEYSLFPLPDGGVLWTLTDVTDRIRFQKALTERSEALEAADRLKSQFITNMSYELRTPLNSIIGFAEILDQKLFGELNKQQSSYIRDILSSADQLKRMISDVLDLAVLEAGEMDINKESVNLSDTIEEAYRLAFDLARKNGVTLKYSAPREHFMVEGDKSRLKQAFYNMIIATLPFARSGSYMALQLQHGDDEHIFKVTADETGMTSLERDRLVEAITSGSLPEGRRITGLDLALVRSIVKLHHGDVVLDRSDESGIVLMCHLPKSFDSTLADDQTSQAIY